MVMVGGLIDRRARRLLGAVYIYSSRPNNYCNGIIIIIIIGESA
jgi:hypothetical protein